MKPTLGIRLRLCSLKIRILHAEVLPLYLARHESLRTAVGSGIAVANSSRNLQLSRRRKTGAGGTIFFPQAPLLSTLAAAMQGGSARLTYLCAILRLLP